MGTFLGIGYFYCVEFWGGFFCYLVLEHFFVEGLKLDVGLWRVCQDDHDGKEAFRCGFRLNRCFRHKEAHIILQQIDRFLYILKIRNNKRMPQQPRLHNLPPFPLPTILNQPAIALHMKNLPLTVNQPQLEIEPKIMHLPQFPTPNNNIIRNKVHLKLKEHINRTVIVQAAIEIVPEDIVGCVFDYVLV